MSTLPTNDRGFYLKETFFKFTLQSLFFWSIKQETRLEHIYGKQVGLKSKVKKAKKSAFRKS